MERKDIKKISEIKNVFSKSSLDAKTILQSFKALKLTSSFLAFKEIKKQGYDFKLVLAMLMKMAILPEKTVNSSLPKIGCNGKAPGKDVFYRVKNNEKICWRWILWIFVMKFLQLTREDLQSINSSISKSCYLIFDDSVLPKTGKRIEKIGKVHDHTVNAMVLGFKILVALYFDGTTAIPVDFTFHRERSKNKERPFGLKFKELRRQYNKKRIKESEGAKRVKELDKSKIEMMLRMFWSAIYRNMKVDYVLVDSWFCCDALIKAVWSAGVHLIGMYKIASTKFKFRGKCLNIKEIRSILGAPKRCKKVGFYYLRADVLYAEKPITLFFSRQGKRGKWKVFLTTDNRLSFIELVQHYQNRWQIEVFFKETKQLLNLGGCQSSNFDAQIADTTVIMLMYILLAFRKRYEDYESMGALFRSMNADILQETLDLRLWQLFLELVEAIAFLLEMDVYDLIKKILTIPKIERLFASILEIS